MTDDAATVQHGWPVKPDSDIATVREALIATEPMWLVAHAQMFDAQIFDALIALARVEARLGSLESGREAREALDAETPDA